MLVFESFAKYCKNTTFSLLSCKNAEKQAILGGFCARKGLFSHFVQKCQEKNHQKIYTKKILSLAPKTRQALYCLHSRDFFNKPIDII